LDASNLRNVELTIYINELKEKIQMMEDVNRKKDHIANWKSYEELSKQVHEFVTLDEERMRTIKNLQADFNRTSSELEDEKKALSACMK